MHAHETPTEELLRLDEPGARRLLLAQALEEGDPQGLLVGAVEREQVDREAIAATGDPAQGQTVDEKRYLLTRAERLVELLRHRQPRLADLQSTPDWQRLAGWGLPLLALVVGALIDRIDNPRQVNLLSPPLLAFLLWNLAVYLLLAVNAVWRHRRPAAASTPAWPAWATRWTGRRLAGPRAAVAQRFQQAWWHAAGRLEGQRWRRTLHLSAAAWGVGVALAIMAGGLVREYRIGWESTLLDLPQVHAFLRVLFAPVVAVWQVEPFSQAELARLHFGSGADIGRLEARRWVFLYVGLIGLLVVLPRVLLAAWAALRQAELARRVTVDMATPYFVQVLGRVRPSRVLLAWIGPDGARAPLAVSLRQMADEPAPASDGVAWTVLRTARGDQLRVVVAGAAPTGTAATVPRTGSHWWSLGSGGSPRGAPSPYSHADVLLLACAQPAEVQALLPVLREAARPVLLVVSGGNEAAYAALLRPLSAPTGVLPVEALPTWREDERLLEALQRLLPPYHAPGMARLVEAWRERSARRLSESMRVLAQELIQVATDVQELAADPVSMRQLVVRGEREATQEGRRQARAALLGRAHDGQTATDARLLTLHALDAGSPARVMANAIPERFRVEHSIHEPQAGLAGAAGGAAMGAAVDLMTGGLTLGAASALGAVLGGGVALVGAAWKNRSAEPGVSVVAMSDEMLLALVQAALLRYLAVVHEHRAPAGSGPDHWADVVESSVAREEEALRGLWASARTGASRDEPAAALAALLERVISAVLLTLNGPARG